MGNTRTCDIHPNTDNFIPIENSRKVTVEQWVKVGERNVLFYVTIDACLECLKRALFDGAESHGVSIQNSWKTDVWQTGRGGKRYTTAMTLPDFTAHVQAEKLREQEAEILKLRMGSGTK